MSPQIPPFQTWSFCVFQMICHWYRRALGSHALLHNFENTMKVPCWMTAEHEAIMGCGQWYIMHLLIWSQGLMFYKMVICVRCINLDSLAANPLHFLPPFFIKWKKHCCQNSRLPSMSLERWVVEQGVYYYFLVKFACLLDCLFVFVYKSACLFFLFAFFPYPHLGVVWKISSRLHIKCQSCL